MHLKNITKTLTVKQMQIFSVIICQTAEKFTALVFAMEDNAVLINTAKCTQKMFKDGAKMG